jgi:hypothetical protein
MLSPKLSPIARGWIRICLCILTYSYFEVHILSAADDLNFLNQKDRQNLNGCNYKHYLSAISKIPENEVEEIKALTFSFKCEENVSVLISAIYNIDQKNRQNICAYIKSVPNFYNCHTDGNYIKEILIAINNIIKEDPESNELEESYFCLKYMCQFACPKPRKVGDSFELSKKQIESAIKDINERWQNNDFYMRERYY